MVPPSPPDDGLPAGLVAKESAGDNAAPLSVSEISAMLKRTVEERFGFVRIRGELSGVKRAASGHLYCSLKDESAVIDAVMWRGNTGRLAFKPEDGLEVIASGKLTTLYGDLSSAWKLNNGTFDWTVIVPPNTTATVNVPVKAGQTITVNGQVTSDSVQNVGAGTYHIVVH